MADNTEKRTFMVAESHDDWLDDKKDEPGMTKSYLVNRALKFYRQKGYDIDKKRKERVKLHKTG